MPLQVGVAFSPLPRRPVNYVGGDPQDLLDYRTIPVIRLEGTDTLSVSARTKSFMHSEIGVHCACIDEQFSATTVSILALEAGC